jgi:two-component system sensor histidine kinase KdpD
MKTCIMSANIFQSKRAGYLFAVLGIGGVTAAFAPFHTQINSTTVALSLLLIVLLIATGWGSWPAYLASLLGMLCFNFFFLPPVYTLTIADPQNWVALAAFLVTALTVGQLSARARRRAEEAEAGHREIERLYHELQAAFERASQAEAFRRSEQLKSALLDAVTHDLRTPLTSIKASVTTLLKERRKVGTGEPPVLLDEEGKEEMLEVIDEEADRLNHFIEGMVELARIEAGGLHLRRRWVEIDEIISMALARAEPLTQRHQVEVQMESELPLVRIDARAVTEVIYLLIDNATKYAPPGTCIRIGASRSSDEMVQIAVEDEGRGIPQRLRKRVFDKFFRATPDYAAALHRPSGIGMGLAIARGIVDAHGGNIWVEDGSGGRGARVVFTVPIGDEDQPATMEGGESENTSQVVDSISGLDTQGVRDE